MSATPRPKGMEPASSKLLVISFVGARGMRISNQTLDGDQTWREENFHGSTTHPAPAKTFVTRKLTRDLSAVANILVVYVN